MRLHGRNKGSKIAMEKGEEAKPSKWNANIR